MRIASTAQQRDARTVPRFDEITADAALEIFRFADVQHRLVGPDHAINARAGWERLQGFFDAGGHGAQRNVSMIGFSLKPLFDMGMAS